MDSDWDLSIDEWRLMSRCNKCALQLYPYNQRQQDSWSESAYKKCINGQISPEGLRDQQCPALAKKPADLPLSALMLLEQDNHALHLNLFGNGGVGSTSMPADTVARRNSGQLQESDIPFLRASGLHYDAAQVAQQSQRQQDQRLVDVASTEAAANEEQKAFSQAWNNADLGKRLAMSGGPSPQAIAQARAMWGVTGE